MNEFIEKLKGGVITAAMRVNRNANEKDVDCNHVNYGHATAIADSLRYLGHEVNIPVWCDDNGCLRIPKLSIDGKVTSFCHDTPNFPAEPVDMSEPIDPLTIKIAGELANQLEARQHDTALT